MQNCQSGSQKLFQHYLKKYRDGDRRQREHLNEKKFI